METLAEKTVPTNRPNRRYSGLRVLRAALIASALPGTALAAAGPDFVSPSLAYLAVKGNAAGSASVTNAVWTARGLDAFGDHGIFGAYLAGGADDVAVVGAHPRARVMLGAASAQERLLMVLLGGGASLPVAGASARRLSPGDILLLEAGKTALSIGRHGLLAITVELPAASPAETGPAQDFSGSASWPPPPDSLAKLTDPGLDLFRYFRMQTGPDGASHVSAALWRDAVPDPVSSGLFDFFRAPARHLNLVSAKPGYRTPPHNVGAAAELDVVLRGSSTGLYGNGATQLFRSGDMVLIDDKGSKGRAVRIGDDGYLALSVNLAR